MDLASVGTPQVLEGRSMGTLENEVLKMPDRLSPIHRKTSVSKSSNQKD